jgi:LysR family transcriptional regulator, hydrogen peroxide-inducible genes activator
MELYQLEYFLEAARQQNFTRAAARLHLAQAALSEQIRKLEDDLGAKLFHRGKRETVLTSAGETLRQHAEALLDRAAAARIAVQDLVGLRSGKLNIGAVPSVSACLLPQVIAAFRTKHPLVEMALHEGTSEQVARWVESGRVECGIVQTPTTEGDFDVEHLFTEPFVLLVPENHPAARKKVVTLQKLNDEPFIFYKGRARDSAMSACRNAGFEPRIACESSELETIRGLVGAGLGIAILPKLATRGGIKQCRILDIKAGAIQRQIAVISRAGHEPSPSGRVFRKLLSKWSNVIV